MKKSKMGFKQLKSIFSNLKNEEKLNRDLVSYPNVNPLREYSESSRDIYLAAFVPKNSSSLTDPTSHHYGNFGSNPYSRDSFRDAIDSLEVLDEEFHNYVVFEDSNSREKAQGMFKTTKLEDLLEEESEDPDYRVWSRKTGSYMAEKEFVVTQGYDPINLVWGFKSETF